MPKESAVESEPAAADKKTNHQIKISFDELQRKIADPNTSKAELAKYLLVDNGPRPFRLWLRPNPSAVDMTEYEGVQGIMSPEQILMALYNDSQRKSRLRDFNEAISGGYSGKIIVSEGDSWFMYFPRDIIDDLWYYGFAIRSLEAGGDTLQNIYDQDEYVPALLETNASVFLLSGGGNDLVAHGALQEHLRYYDPNLSASEHLLPSFYDLLDDAMTLYDGILQRIEASRLIGSLSANMLTICHGYDYCIPNNQQWLGWPMNARDITDRTFQAAIARAMVDEFNVRLKLLTDKFSNTRFLDLRNVVGPGRWSNELHPNWDATPYLALKFKAEIDNSATASS